MRKMFKSKKGVSPLIATVLLIAFAVSLGAVVMNWGKTYVEQTAEDVGQKSTQAITCAMDVSLNIVDIGGRKKVCYDENNLQFTIENGPIIPLVDIQVTIIGADDVNSTMLGKGIGKAGITRGIVGISGLGAIEQVKFVPMIKFPGQNEGVFCSDSTLIIEDIGTC